MRKDIRAKAKASTPLLPLGAAAAPRGRSGVEALALARMSLRKAARSTGNSRTLTPVAAKMALHRAGAAAVVPASPTPPGGLSVGMWITSTAGVSLMRSIR